MKYPLTQAGARKRGKRPGCKSKYKGVCWHPRCQRWQAKIGLNRKQHSLGYFRTEEEAARAYDGMAKQLFGEHARLNFEESK